MGVIYEGTHLTIGRKIAVKFLHSEIAVNEDLIIRFQNEAKLAASIGHRNIVDIMDMGTYRGRLHYIVMEYLDGRNLGSALEMGRGLLQEEATDLAIQILNGLKAAHRKGIVHRDLKPENIFLVTHLDGEKYVKILDFGISKLIDEKKAQDVKLTRTGMIFGTPRYMSPEQARGKDTVDHRADLYSVGAIYYEMLCGTPMFTGGNYSEIIVEVLTNDPAPLVEKNPSVSPDLAAIVMKSVAKDPGARFQSASEFIESIAPFSSTPVFVRCSSGEIVFTDNGLTLSTGLALDKGDMTPEPNVVEAGENSSTPPAASSTPSSTPPGGSGGGKREIEVFARMPTLTPRELIQDGGDTPSLDDSGLSITPGEWSLRQSFPPQTIENSQAHRLSGKKNRALLIFGVLGISAVAVLAFWGASKLYLKSGGTDQPMRVLVGSPVALEAVPSPAHLTIENLPEAARVFVDGALHLERPILVEISAVPHRVKIVSGKTILMDEKVVILGDISMSLAPREEAGEADSPSVKSGKKKSSNKSLKGKAGKKKRSIDMVYPM